MGTGGPFPGGKARPGRDTDHLSIKGKALPQHTYGGSGERGGIAPTHSRLQRLMVVSGAINSHDMRPTALLLFKRSSPSAGF
jgi:hypothetical protein